MNKLRIAIGCLLLLTACANEIAEEPGRTQLRVLLPADMELPVDLAIQFSARWDVDVVELTAVDGEAAIKTMTANVENPAADLVIGLDLLALAASIESGAFAVYESPELPFLDPRLVIQSEGVGTPIAYRDYCPLYDHVRLSELEIDPPRGFLDLADERFTSELTFPDPSRGRDGKLLLLNVIINYGEETGITLFRVETDETKPVWTDSVATSFFDVFNSPARTVGPAVTWGAAGMIAIEERFKALDAEPEDLLLRVATTGCLRVGDYAAVALNAAEPDLARAFIDQMLQPESQLTLLDVRGTLPARQGLELPVEYSRVPNPPIARVIRVSEVAENLSDWLAEWTRPPTDVVENDADN